MITYTWHTTPAPDGLRVQQVYGWIFDHNGRVAIWLDHRGHFGLPGGSPEPADADPEATLRRETLEEVTAEITDPHYLGYQHVHFDSEPPFAQIRMIARLDQLLPPEPDPDTGRMKTRMFLHPDHAADLLNWGAHGHQQADAATALAHARWSLPTRRGLQR